MSNDQENQSDEISVLQSIYNDEELTITREDGLCCGEFHAFVSVPEKILLVYKNLMRFEDELESIRVEHLPPVCLYFTLPLTYPSGSPPQYTISCPWLTVKLIVYLSMRLEELWLENSGMPILYTWMDFLKNESLNYLEVTNVLDIRGIFTQDLKHRSRKTRKNESRPEKSKPDFWEERRKCWSNRKNAKLRRHQQDKAACDKRTATNSVASSALDDAPDLDSSSRLVDDIQLVDPQNITKSEFCSEPETAHASPVKVEKYENFTKSVKDKFGLEVRRPGYLHKITMGQITKHSSKVERRKNSASIIALLVSFNEDRTVSQFKRGFYTCDICFQSQIGAKCVQFQPCEHIYCAECIKSYFSVRVNENTVQSMPCPHDQCGSEASQTQIKEILGEEVYSRYDRLLLSAALDTMADVAYCPRRGCQLPTLVEPDRMAYCHACAFAFCALCLRTYHGLQPCAMKNEERRRLALSYQDSTGAERALLEARYGKQQLVTLLHNVLSTDWISNNSKHCPSCKTAIEKSDGCNKMVCTKCGAVFCWLCHGVLDRRAPYKHFYDLKSKCYNQLFLGLAPSDDEDALDPQDDEGPQDDEDALDPQDDEGPQDDEDDDNDILLIYGEEEFGFDDIFFGIPDDEEFAF